MGRARDSNGAQSWNGIKTTLLQGQLRASFRFNSLNSISALVRGDDRRVAGRSNISAPRFASFTLYTSGKNEWVTVAEELQFVGDYLDMQNYDLVTDYDQTWRVAAQDWLRIPCPPAIVSNPLVENAVHHGVENHQEECQLRSIFSTT